VVICEEPRIAPYKGRMRARLAEVLGIPVEQVNVKGKTTEGLGFTGRSEGIAVQAVALVEKVSQ
jgi:2-C-methyl-D-erythritol 4-phosphate cytidylyltransferase/2-C-methyl-D-erythritol 2,4-cyclodiphosphate synthase